MINLNTFKITEVYTFIILLVYSLLSIISFESNNIYLINNLLIILYLIGLNIIDKRIFKNKMGVSRFLLLIPIMYLMYSQVQNYIGIFHSGTYDELLIHIDRLIIGVDVSEYFNVFHNKYLTEYLQISYLSFYILPVVNGIELFNKDKNEFYYFARIIVFTFYFSYLLYLFLPAIGPRFCVYDFSNISNELPGIYFTEIIREFVNIGGGIKNLDINPSIQVNRDCMPSGHTMITIINMYLALKFKTKIRLVHILFGLSLIISTMYLRYHYFIDIIVGIIFAIISIKAEKYLFNFFSKERSND